MKRRWNRSSRGATARPAPGKQEAEEKLRMFARVLHSAAEGIMITDPGGRIVSVNPAFSRITGYSEGEAVGRNPNLLKSDVQQAQFYVDLWAAVHAAGYWEGEIWNRRKNGDLYPQKLSISTVRDEGGAIRHYVGIFTDMTERKQADIDLRLYARLFESASEGIMITDTNGRILSVNPAFTATTGYTLEEVVGRSPRILHSGMQDAAFYVDMWAAIHATGCWQGEIWNRRKNGDIYAEWLSINAVREENGRISNYVGMFTDITERKKSEEHLKYLALYDPLTELPNRTLFRERLQQALQFAGRQRQRVALLFIDLDNFKFINDSLGHAYGDQLLQQAAKRLKSCVRKNDMVARLGGDEFIIVLPHIAAAQDAIHVVKHIFEQFDAPFTFGPHTHFATASIGVSVYPEDGDDPETLIQHADLAMYHAKNRRNDKFQLYAPHMNDQLKRRMELERALRDAMAKDQLHMYYQPQMDIRTGTIAGMEALLRWKHPELGLISPAEFIPLAEETGLIVEIGDWVLRQVCGQNKAWQNAGCRPVKVSVNLSAIQFQQRNLADQIRDVLRLTGLEPKWLCLEITETISMYQVESIRKTLQELKAIGVDVAIDDFGKGHSALSYLKRFPIDIVKIDKCFIEGIHNDPENEAIVRAVTDLAHGLRLQVIAEGVETEEELAVLKQLRCDCVQGFLLGRPVAAEAMERLLAGDREAAGR
ncbi:MAG: EAL domain-containing protein [Paenibacillaceae bacterium]|nr:EAL domain-containing protein [Paenibacillaceae bacterium]